MSEKTVAGSMRRHGLVARRITRRNGLTRQDKTAPKFPDLLKRDFTADRPHARWVGDMTEVPTVDAHGRPGEGDPPARVARGPVEASHISHRQGQHLYRSRVHETMP